MRSVAFHPINASILRDSLNFLQRNCGRVHEEVCCLCFSLSVQRLRYCGSHRRLCLLAATLWQTLLRWWCAMQTRGSL